MKQAILLCALLTVGCATSGCGDPPPINVVLTGETPIFGLKEFRTPEGFIRDDRRVEYFCPSCRHPDISFKRKECKWCETKISWPKTIWCKYCNGSGKCPSCMIARKNDGKCFNCAGLGYNKFGGDCPNCNANGKCPICAGSAKCDFCGGEGRVSLDMLETQRERLTKPSPVIGTPGAAPEGEDERAPEGEEKKPDGESPKENKEEEKRNE